MIPVTRRLSEAPGGVAGISHAMYTRKSSARSQTFDQRPDFFTKTLGLTWLCIRIPVRRNNLVKSVQW